MTDRVVKKSATLKPVNSGARYDHSKLKIASAKEIAGQNKSGSGSECLLTAQQRPKFLRSICSVSHRRIEPLRHKPSIAK